MVIIIFCKKNSKSIKAKTFPLHLPRSVRLYLQISVEHSSVHAKGRGLVSPFLYTGPIGVSPNHITHFGFLGFCLYLCQSMSDSYKERHLKLCISLSGLARTLYILCCINSLIRRISDNIFSALGSCHRYQQLITFAFSLQLFSISSKFCLTRLDSCQLYKYTEIIFLFFSLPFSMFVQIHIRRFPVFLKKPWFFPAHSFICSFVYFFYFAK